MTQDNGLGMLQRWALVVFAMILALGLLVLSLLDYAISARSAVGILGSVLVLGLLSILSIRLCHTGGGNLYTVSAAPTGEVSRTTALVVLIIVTTLAAALRLYQLGAESFWYDETWTATWASQPAGVVLGRVSPLPHLAAHLSLSLGRSEFVLRLAPSFAGILLTPAAYLLGQVLYGRKEGLLTAGVLTVSLYAIYHSQELRFYAWQMLFSTLTLAFLLRGLAGRRWLDWAGFVVTTVLNLYSHPFGLFVLASEGVYVVGAAIASSSAAHKGLPVGDRRRYVALVRHLATPALCALLALIAFGPGWSHLSSLTSSSNWSVESELAAVGMQRSSWLSTPIATWLYELPSWLLAANHPAYLLPIFALFLVGLLSSSRRRVALILLWLLIPPVVLAFVRVRFYHRYLSYFLPLFMIVVSHGINYVASMVHTRRQGLVVMTLLAVLVATPSLIRLPAFYQGTQKTQWREAISFVEANHQPGDIVLVAANYVVGAPEQPIDWYRTLLPAELSWQYFLKEGTLGEPAQYAELYELTKGYGRVWFLLPTALDVEEISVSLQGSFQLALKQEFVHLKVLLYKPVSSG